MEHNTRADHIYIVRGRILKMRTVSIDALIDIANRIEAEKSKELFFELLEECGHPYSIRRLLVYIINNYGKSAVGRLEEIRQSSDDEGKQKTIKLALFNLENMKPEVDDAEDPFTAFCKEIDDTRQNKGLRLQMLEVATGAAGFVREAQRHRWGRNAQITAIDGSGGMVENALVLSFIEVLLMNWGKMSFENNSFDLITYNFPSPNAGLASVGVAFKEIFRVCRDGGGLAFYSTDDEFNGFNSEKIIEKLEAAGFERKNIQIFKGEQVPASYPQTGTSAQITRPKEAKQIYLILARKPVIEVSMIESAEKDPKAIDQIDDLKESPVKVFLAGLQLTRDIDARQSSKTKIAVKIGNVALIQENAPNFNPKYYTAYLTFYMGYPISLNIHTYGISGLLDLNYLIDFTPLSGFNENEQVKALLKEGLEDEDRRFFARRTKILTTRFTKINKWGIDEVPHFVAGTYAPGGMATHLLVDNTMEAITEEMTILDLGSGAGLIGAALRNQTNCTVVCLDHKETAVLNTRITHAAIGPKDGRKVEVVLSDLFEKFEGRKFDAVYFFAPGAETELSRIMPGRMGVSEMKDPESFYTRLFSEISDYLNKGGALYLVILEGSEIVYDKLQEAGLYYQVIDSYTDENGGWENLELLKIQPALRVRSIKENNETDHKILSSEMFKVASGDVDPFVRDRFTLLGRMLSILEEWLARSGKNKGTPVAERKDGQVVWHMSVTHIRAILRVYGFTNREIDLLLDQIDVHEAELTEEKAVQAQIKKMNRLKEKDAWVRNNNKKYLAIKFIISGVALIMAGVLEKNFFLYVKWMQLVILGLGMACFVTAYIIYPNAKRSSKRISRRRLNTVRQFLKDHPDQNVMGVIVFGSTARLEAEEDSDVDILLVKKQGPDPLIYQTGDLDFLDDLTKKLGVVATSVMPLLLKAGTDQDAFGAFDLTLMTLFIPASWIGAMMYDPRGMGDRLIGDYIVIARTRQQEQYIRGLIDGRIAQITAQNGTQKKGLVNNLDKEAEDSVLDTVKNNAYMPIEGFDRFVAPRINVFARFFYTTKQPARAPPAFVWARENRGQLQIFLSRKAKRLLGYLFTPQELPIVYESIARHEYAEVLNKQAHRQAVKEQRKIKDYDVIRDRLELMQVLLEQDYPVKRIPDLVARFAKLMSDIGFSEIRANIVLGDTKNIEKGACALLNNLGKLYYKNDSNILKLTRVLVEYYDDNLMDAISMSKRPLKMKRKIVSRLSTCAAKAQLVHVLLELLGVNGRSVTAPQHAFNAVLLPNGKTLIVDVSMNRIIRIQISKWYYSSGKYLVVRRGQMISNPAMKRLQKASDNQRLLPDDLSIREIICFCYGSIQIMNGRALVSVIHNNIAETYREIALNKQSVQKYKKAKEYNPDDARLCSNLGRVYLKQRQVAKGRKEFERSVELNPAYSLGYQGLAFTYRIEKDLERALQVLKEGNANNPGCDEILQIMGLDFMLLKDFEGAIKAFKAAVKINRTYAGHFYNLGSAYAASGRVATAVKHWAKAIAINPEFSFYISNEFKDEVVRYQANQKKRSEKDEGFYANEFDDSEKGRRVSIKVLLEQNKEEIAGLSITAASKVLGVSRKGLSRFVNLNRWAIARYQLEVGAMPTAKVNIGSALIEHEEDVRGKTVYQIKNIIGCSGQGLRDHLRINPDVERDLEIVRGEESEPYIQRALEEHAQELRGRTVGEAAEIIDSSSSGLHGYLERHPGEINRYRLINIGNARTCSNYYVPSERQHRRDRESGRNTDSSRDQDKRSKGYYGDVTAQELSEYVANIELGFWRLELSQELNVFNIQIEGMDIDFYVLNYGANAPPLSKPYIFAIEKEGKLQVIISPDVYKTLTISISHAFKNNSIQKLGAALRIISRHEYKEVVEGKSHEQADRETREEFDAGHHDLIGLFDALFEIDDDEANEEEMCALGADAYTAYAFAGIDGVQYLFEPNVPSEGEVIKGIKSLDRATLIANNGEIYTLWLAGITWLNSSKWKFAFNIVEPGALYPVEDPIGFQGTVDEELGLIEDLDRRLMDIRAAPEVGNRLLGLGLGSAFLKKLSSLMVGLAIEGKIANEPTNARIFNALNRGEIKNGDDLKRVFLGSVLGRSVLGAGFDPKNLTMLYCCDYDIGARVPLEDDDAARKLATDWNNGRFNPIGYRVVSETVVSSNGDDQKDQIAYRSPFKFIESLSKTVLDAGLNIVKKGKAVAVEAASGLDKEHRDALAALINYSIVLSGTTKNVGAENTTNVFMRDDISIRVAAFNDQYFGCAMDNSVACVSDDGKILYINIDVLTVIASLDSKAQREDFMAFIHGQLQGHEVFHIDDIRRTGKTSEESVWERSINFIERDQIILKATCRVINNPKVYGIRTDFEMNERLNDLERENYNNNGRSIAARLFSEGSLSAENLAVAQRTVNRLNIWKADAEVIGAAWLLSVDIERVSASMKSEIITKLGGKVYEFIESYKELKKIVYIPRIKGGKIVGRKTIENYIKLFVISAKHYEVIVLRLARMTELLSTLKMDTADNREFAKYLSLKARHVDSILAEFLLLRKAASVLRSKSLMVLDPEEYERIEAEILGEAGFETREEGERYLDRVSVAVKGYLLESGQKCSGSPEEGITEIRLVDIRTRLKSVYSYANKERRVREKAVKSGKPVEAVEDILGVMIVVESEEDVHAAHALLQNVQQEIGWLKYNRLSRDLQYKDPKVWGKYAGYHTALKDEYGRSIEVVLFDRVNYEKYLIGTSAHWEYAAQKDEKELADQSFKDLMNVQMTGELKKDFQSAVDQFAKEVIVVAVIEVRQDQYVYIPVALGTGATLFDLASHPLVDVVDGPQYYGAYYIEVGEERGEIVVDTTGVNVARRIKARDQIKTGTTILFPLRAKDSIKLGIRDTEKAITNRARLIAAMLSLPEAGKKSLMVSGQEKIWKNRYILKQNENAFSQFLLLIVDAYDYKDLEDLYRAYSMGFITDETISNFALKLGRARLEGVIDFEGSRHLSEEDMFIIRQENILTAYSLPFAYVNDLLHSDDALLIALGMNQIDINDIGNKLSSSKVGIESQYDEASKVANIIFMFQSVRPGRLYSVVRLVSRYGNIKNVSVSEAVGVPTHKGKYKIDITIEHIGKEREQELLRAAHSILDVSSRSAYVWQEKTRKKETKLMNVQLTLQNTEGKLLNILDALWDLDPNIDIVSLQMILSKIGVTKNEADLLLAIEVPSWITTSKVISLLKMTYDGQRKKGKKYYAKVKNVNRSGNGGFVVYELLAGMAFLGSLPAFINKENLFGIIVALMAIISFVVLVYLLNKFLRMRVIALLKQIANWLRFNKLKEKKKIDALKDVQIADIKHIAVARQRKRSAQAVTTQSKKRTEDKMSPRFNNKGFVNNELLLSFSALMISAAIIHQAGPIAGLGIILGVLGIIFIVYLIKMLGNARMRAIAAALKNIITFNGAVRAKTNAFLRTAREIARERRLVNSIHERWREAVVVFGSARIPDDDPLYSKAMQIGVELFKAGMAVRSGAGPSMMEAPLRGYVEERIRQGVAKDQYNMTQGIRIKLPFEQKTSPYVEDNYEFNHFVIRKMGLYNNCRGIIAMPGGFGTMDELFDVWFRGLPIVLVGIEYWTPIIEVIRRVTKEIGVEGQISNWPLMTDSPQEAVRMIKESEPKVMKETKNYLDEANKDLESNMKKLSKWKRSVTFIGQADIKNKMVENVVRTLAKMLEAKDIPGRSVTRNKNVGIALLTASKRTDKMLQQTILIPGRRFLYLKRNRIVTTSATNHHVLIEQNSRGFVFLPGRIKTLSRLFDLVAVMQTGKVEKRPIVLIGRFFWEPVIGAIVKSALDCPAGALIRQEDIKLFVIVDSAEEAFKHLGLENIPGQNDRAIDGELTGKRSGVLGKRIIASVIILSIANASVYFRDEYAAFIGSVSWLGALLIRLLLGAVTRGAGVYIKQAVKGERTDHREIIRWMIVGAFMVGFLVFAVLYPLIRMLGLTPVEAALFDLFIYAPFISLPLSFIFYEYFISRESIKKKINLKNIFVTGKKSVKAFYVTQLVYWFAVLTVGWIWFAEYMDIYIVNMSIVWSAILAFMFDRTNEEQNKDHDNDQNVLRQEKTSDKYTITSLLLYGFAGKIINIYPEAGKTIRVYADMLVILEEFLAMSGKVRAGPALVAYYDPMLDTIIYNLSPEEIQAILIDKYPEEKIQALISFIVQHEELHQSSHPQGSYEIYANEEESVLQMQLRKIVGDFSKENDSLDDSKYCSYEEAQSFASILSELYFILDSARVSRRDSLSILEHLKNGEPLKFAQEFSPDIKSWAVNWVKRIKLEFGHILPFLEVWHSPSYSELIFTPSQDAIIILGRSKSGKSSLAATAQHQGFEFGGEHDTKYIMLSIPGYLFAGTREQIFKIRARAYRLDKTDPDSRMVSIVNQVSAIGVVRNIILLEHNQQLNQKIVVRVQEAADLSGIAGLEVKMRLAKPVNVIHLSHGRTDEKEYPELVRRMAMSITRDADEKLIYSQTIRRYLNGRARHLFKSQSERLLRYADMLEILERYIAVSGKLRGGPQAVAFFSPTINEVVYNLTEQEINDILKSKYSPVEVRSLILFIHEHEQLHKEFHQMGISFKNVEIEEGIILTRQLNRADLASIVNKEFIKGIIEQLNRESLFVNTQIAQVDGRYRLGGLVLADLTEAGLREEFKEHYLGGAVGCIDRIFNSKKVRLQFDEPRQAKRAAIGIINSILEIEGVDSYSSHEVWEIAFEVLRHIIYGDHDEEIKNDARRSGLLALDNIVLILRRVGSNALETLARIAAMGNSWDLLDSRYIVQANRDRKLHLAGIEEELKREDFWRFNNIKEFDKLLNKPLMRVLYLVDNVGEDAIDLILVRELLVRGNTVVMAAKALPCGNDSTEQDLRTLIKNEQVRALIGEENLSRLSIIDSGSIVFGTDLARTSKEFEAEWEKADLIISKGQANYFTLRPYSLTKPCLYLFRVKWPAEANIVEQRGFSRGDYIAELVDISQQKIDTLQDGPEFDWLDGSYSEMEEIEERWLDGTIEKIVDESLPWRTRYAEARRIVTFFDVAEGNLAVLRMLRNPMLREEIFEEKMGKVWASLLKAKNAVILRTRMSDPINQKLVRNIEKKMHEADQKLVHLFNEEGIGKDQRVKDKEGGNPPSSIWYLITGNARKGVLGAVAEGVVLAAISVALAMMYGPAVAFGLMFFAVLIWAGYHVWFINNSPDLHESLQYLRSRNKFVLLVQFTLPLLSYLVIPFAVSLFSLILVAVIAVLWHVVLDQNRMDQVNGKCIEFENTSRIFENRLLPLFGIVLVSYIVFGVFARISEINKGLEGLLQYILVFGFALMSVWFYRVWIVICAAYRFARLNYLSQIDVSRFSDKKIRLINEISSLSIGGAEQVTLRLVNAIDKNKYDVIVLTHESDEKYEELISKARKVGVQFIFKEKGVSLKQLLLKFRVLKFIEEVITTFVVGLAVYQAIRPDVAHFQMVSHVRDFIKKAVLRIFTNCSVVVTTYHNIPQIYQGTAKGLLRKTKVKLVHVVNLLGFVLFDDLLIALTEKEKQLHNKSGVPLYKMAVVPNGIDAKIFIEAPGDVETLPFGDDLKAILRDDKNIIIGTVGRLVPQKGYPDLIKAAQIAVGSMDNIYFLIVGEGQERESLEAQIKSAGLQERFFMPGRVEHDDMPALYAAFDVFVMSSIHEGLPTVGIEALFAKKPFIGTDIIGIPEIIGRDERSGLLTKPRDPADMAEKIIGLTRDPQRMERMGEEGQKRALEQFCVERAALDHQE